MKTLKIKRYTRLSNLEREQIAIDLAIGKNPFDIADTLSRSPSTVTREIRRNTDSQGNYRALYAAKIAQSNASNRRFGKRKISQNFRLQKRIHRAIKKRNSPQQIANRLKRLYPHDYSMSISHEAIYSYLYAMPRGDLKKSLLADLRRRHKRRRNGRKAPKKPRPLEDMVLIDQRPAEVEGRAVPGHWEGDLIIGRNRQSAIGVLLERKTRFTILVKLKSRKAEEVCSAFAKKIVKLPEHIRKSLTYDQGREMAKHKKFSMITKMPVYFAHPASPWEKGSAENTNGLLRQYFPKGTDFNKVPLKEINRVQHELNDRPRAVIEYATPAEALTEILH